MDYCNYLSFVDDSSTSSEEAYENVVELEGIYFARSEQSVHSSSDSDYDEVGNWWMLKPLILTSSDRNSTPGNACYHIYLTSRGYIFKIKSFRFFSIYMFLWSLLNQTKVFMTSYNSLNEYKLIYTDL